jgi:hypothetical protein
MRQSAIGNRASAFSSDCRLPIAYSRLLAKTGERPGGARGAGDGEPRGEAEGAKTAVEIGEKAPFAAVQVSRTGDVDEQAIGTAGLVPGSGERGIAHGPQRQPVEGGGVGRRIGLADLQVEDLGAGIGEEIAGDEPTPPCG